MAQIRNFCILAHIDHGKSTLADRFLELTKTIPASKMKPQFLDMMDLERERGITIKLAPVRLEFEFSIFTLACEELVHFKFSNNFQNPNSKSLGFSDSKFVLNLIDTPGHVDFSYEVSRSLAAVEGAVLLVDATKGIQAQTLANLEIAQQQNLVIIPAVNKIDSPQADVEKTAEELANLLKTDKNEIIKISAKNGTNVERVLEAIIKKVPAPVQNQEKPFRALIFDSKYDAFRGVIAYIRVVDGEIKAGSKIKLLAAKVQGEAKELGYFKPELSPQNKISAGEIGYIATGIKEPGLVRVGDTITEISNSPSFAKASEGKQFPITNVEPLPGYKEAKPMIFASLYPENSDDFDLLKDGLSKLKLNDPSLVYEQETKEALGRGFNCGFLGTLHAEIISERLHREFGLGLVISTPSVVYKIIDNQNREKFIYSAGDWPDSSQIKESFEPWVNLEIITPSEYMGRISEILKNLRGNYIETKYLGFERLILVYEVPLSEIIVNLYEQIKSASRGYASMNYKVIGYKSANLVKMEILIAGEKEEAFSKIIPEDRSFQEGKKIVVKLKETLPSQQFSVALQAVVGGKIIARETIKAQRKDVTGYLYGGDYSRKKKLLEKQKKGKKLLKAKGRVNIPPKTYLEMFRQ